MFSEANSPHPFAKIFDSFLLFRPESLSNLYLGLKSLRLLLALKSVKHPRDSWVLLWVATGRRDIVDIGYTKLGFSPTEF